MRGRIGWWRRFLQPDGTYRILSKEEAQTYIALLRSFLSVNADGVNADGVNADVLATPEELAEEKRRRIGSAAFAGLRRSGVKQRVVNGREDVKERALRIDRIAQRIHAERWHACSSSWIAGRLAPEWKLSINTLRLDVAAAKKLIGSQQPKKLKS